MEKRIKVLLVEDEADFRQIVRVWLGSKGYEVIEASNGKDAIGKIKDGSPDIIFMDLHMPVMNGIEALKEIRKIDADVPVMIISAYLDDSLAQEAASHGVSGVFSKDEEFEKWQVLLETALRTHKKLKK